MHGGYPVKPTPQSWGVLAQGLPVKSVLLDSLKTIQDTECPQPIGEIRHRKSGKRYRLSCGKYTCPVCGNRKVGRIRNRVLDGTLDPETMLTFTFQENDDVDPQAAFNRFVTSLRDDGHRVRYFRVTERTRAGKRHYHALVEGWLPYRELSKRWKRATGGKSKWIHARAIHDRKGAVRYITKYMTKALAHHFEKGERRYTASRGVLPPVIHEKGEWDTWISPKGKGYVKGRWYDDYRSWSKRSERDFWLSLGHEITDDQCGLFAVENKTIREVQPCLSGFSAIATN
jgi:hypothetical protein